MKTFLVLECLLKTGMINNGPTIKKVVEFRFCIVGSDTAEKARVWARQSLGWGPSIRLRHEGFHAFSYERACAIVLHACEFGRTVNFCKGKIVPARLDPYDYVIRAIPAYLVESLAPAMLLEKFCVSSSAAE